MLAGCLPLLALATYIDYSYSMGTSGASHELYAGANKTATEALSSMRVIHSYNLQVRYTIMLLMMLLVYSVVFNATSSNACHSLVNLQAGRMVVSSYFLSLLLLC